MSEEQNGFDAKQKPKQIIQYSVSRCYVETFPYVTCASKWYARNVNVIDTFQSHRIITFLFIESHMSGKIQTSK